MQIARLPGYQYGTGIEPQSLPTDLPATIELTENEHLLLAPSVATRSALPTGNNLIDGMVRWITEESIFVEYQAELSDWVFLGTPNTFIDDTTVEGSDRNLTELAPNEVIAHPIYPPAPNTKVLPAWESNYFLYNNEPNPLPAGTEFGIELFYNDKKSPDLLNGLFLIRFNGFTDPAGELRTTDGENRPFSNVGGFISWEPKVTTPFITDDDLQPGESISISVKPFFSTADLNNQVPPGSVVGVIPAIRTQSGDFNPISKLLNGNYVFAKGDLYRILPSEGLSFTIGSGTAIVAGYDFPQKPSRIISGLQENLANQQVVINGNGAVFVEAPTYTPTPTEDLRALIGTEAGESQASDWSGYLALNNEGINITSAIPQAIRSAYPDAIAGEAVSVNANLFYTYIERQSDSSIKRFGPFSFAASDINLVLTISDWDGGGNVQIPTPGADFSLFTPSAATITVNPTGNFQPDNYRVALTFGYEGTEITKISHASPPAIAEYPGDFQPPTINVISTTTVGPAEPANVVDTNPLSNIADLEFTIPRGNDGFTPVLVGGEGEILPPFSPPLTTVEPTVNENEYQVTVSLPRGKTGDRGPQGAPGESGEQGVAGPIGSANAAGSINLDESSGNNLTLTAGQIGIRNINQELVVEGENVNQLNLSVITKLSLINNLK